MLPPASFAPATVRRIQEWTEGMRTVELDRSLVPFSAGQFFQLGLIRHGKFIKRSYSAASAPGEPGEFFLSLVSHGELTPALFELELGAELFVDPVALGFFTLQEVPACRRLWLVGTGTGLGPYVSMVRQAHDLERFEQVIIVHGARRVLEHAYADQLRAASVRDARIRYLPVTSREAPSGDGLSGRVTTALASGELERAVGTSLDEDSHVLLCGNPQMVEEMTALLKLRGLRKHRRREPGHFNFEKYW